MCAHVTASTWCAWCAVVLATFSAPADRAWLGRAWRQLPGGGAADAPAAYRRALAEVDGARLGEGLRLVGELLGELGLWADALVVRQERLALKRMAQQREDEMAELEAAAALQDVVRRTAVTPRELEVASARLAIGERLGGGSFGRVHAVTLDGGERLALRRVSLAGLPPAQRDETLRAAKREIRALSRLVHLYIVRLYGVVVDEEGSVGMLLELAPRGSLRDLLDTSPAEVVGREAVQMELATSVA